jgi:hypothetical protein
LFPVTSKKLLATIVGAVLALTTGCGTSDSLKSLYLTAKGASAGSFYNLSGQDGTVQLQVLAIYNSGKQIDVTNAVTWNITNVGVDQFGIALPTYGPTTVPINATGLMTGIVSICTWVDGIDNTKTPPVLFNPPQWEYTGFYQTTATYRGFTTQPVAIGVGVEAAKTGGACGPA